MYKSQNRSNYKSNSIRRKSQAKGTLYVTEFDGDSCNPNPCENGDCHDLQLDYRCSCKPGYGGKNCSSKQSSISVKTIKKVSPSFICDHSAFSFII